MTRALAESGQTERTLVFFLSDNGGPVQVAAKNEPLRGTKGQLYEGGIRVPFVVSWPGHLPAGIDYDAPVSSLDIFATAVALAEVPLPAGKKYDGVNLIPYLSGKSKTSPHDRLFWRTEGGQTQAVREGRWKLVRHKDTPGELFDVADDISETRDLAVSIGCNRALPDRCRASFGDAGQFIHRNFLAPYFSFLNEGSL